MHLLQSFPLPTSLPKIFPFSEMFFIALIGWGLIPCTEWIYKNTVSRLIREESNERHKDFADWKTTWFHHFLVLVSEIFKIGLVVYIGDCISTVLRSMGVRIQFFTNLGPRLFKILYFGWMAFRLRTLKRYLFARALSVPSFDESGRAITYYDRLLDYVICIAAGILIYKSLLIETRSVLKWLFSLSGVSSLLIGLSVQDFAANSLNGFSIWALDKVRVREKIKVGGKKKVNGSVIKIGLVETEIKCANDHIVRIPNSYLANQRISYVSRAKRCQVFEKLRFQYKDLDCIPDILTEIKNELNRVCDPIPKPCDIFMHDFREDHVEVVMDLHFDVKASGNAYSENRENVLEAVWLVLQRNDIKLAVPAFQERKITRNEKYVDVA